MEGFISGAVATLCVWPMETIRTQRQVMNKSTIKSCTKNIYFNQGVRGFYKGLWHEMIGKGMFYGLYFKVYDLIRNGYGCNAFMASYLAACGSSVVNNGFYVLRIRYQTHIIKLQNKTSFVNMIRKEGIRGWTQGLGFTLLKNIEIGGIMAVREKMTRDYDVHPTISTFCSKMIFGMMLYPLDTARTLRRCETSPKSLQQILYRFSYNPKSAYYGCMMYLIRSVPSSVIAFTMNDYLKLIDLSSNTK